MNCPVCGISMVKKDLGNVSVDVCENGCKGIWFDRGQLKDLDESHEGFGKALEEALKSPRATDTNRGPLKCPKCDLEMHEHKYKNAKQVDVDECYSCGGFFLDSGELSQIRDNHMNEEERDAYVQKLIEDTPLRDNTYKAKLRAAGCHTLGNLFSRRWPFVRP